MNSKEELHAQQAPEVVGTNYPEALGQGQYQQQYPHHQYGQPTAVAAAGPEAEGHSANSTLYSGTYQSSGSSPFDQHASPPSTYSRPTYADGKPADPADGDGGGGGGGVGVGSGREGRRRGTILGCTALVFALWVVIALLAAAVVGLAVGTGVEAHRASVANAALASGGGGGGAAGATATVTVTSAAPSGTSTSYADIDDNCSSDPTSVTGTTYYSFSVIGDYAFTIRCNADASGSPLLSFFTSSLNTCMDACAAYSRYIPASFSTANQTQSSANATCGAVSFIPSWTNKTAALNAGDGAPGNCYLKPIQTAAPTTPSGQEVHAGILKST